MRRDQRSTPKIIALTAIVFIITSITGVILTSYPQHLYISNNTVIDAIAGFEDNNTVNLRGNQVQYNPGDIIPLEGRDYIRITGNQVQLGDTIYSEAIRTITASLSQNVLFPQKIGEFTINQAAQIGIDNEIINIIPVSMNVVNIRAPDSNYNVEFVQEKTYFKTAGNLFELTNRDGKITVSAIGIRNYQTIWVRTI